MFITLLTDHFHPDISSGGRLLSELAADIVLRGDQVNVITSNVARNTVEEGVINNSYQGVKINRVYSSSFNRTKLIGRLINEISFCFAVFFHTLFKSKIDLIVCISSPPFLPFFAMALSKLRRKPWVYVVMDVYPDIAVNLGLLKKDSLIVKVWDKVFNGVLKASTRIVVLGRCMQDIIQLKLGEKNVPIDIIHNWSNSKTMYPITQLTNPFFKDHPELINKFIIQYSGNLGRFQDFETILSAATHLINEERICFMIVGEGYRRKWLLEEIDKRRLTNVRLYPFQSQSDLIYSLNVADIALITLESGAEGLGVPSKFYPILAVGKPIIALMKQTSEVAMIINEYELGTVINQGDVLGLYNAIHEFVNNVGELNDMSVRARKLFLERFDNHIAFKSYRKSLYKAAGRMS